MAKTVWTIPPSLIEIGFKVKHIMFTKVSRKFNDFQATVENEDSAFETAEILFLVEVGSIDTSNIDYVQLIKR